MNDVLSGVGTILSALVALIFVLLLAYYVLRWVGRRMPAQMGSSKIKVLDRVVLGQDKCLVLVSVAEKVMLVGMSNGAVEKICDVENTEDLIDPPVQTSSFSDALKESLKKNLGGIDTARWTKKGRDE